ncbi:MAG: Unknown protein [uncultured Sulfurovum sp.]|uniref:Trypsin-co-occurring domain-containing protein n=1 Tax=uncultured Sulfurovum sp. TaxID=269237 RepID=A0A6S6UD48_9BACT|nr:MAG: Unknown protein [uncultured Sulfurovum sp.]
MANQYIEIDGIYVEIEAQESERAEISDSSKKIKDKDLGQMKGILSKVSSHLKESWDEINKDMTISEAEVKLSLGFEAEGNLFIAKGKTTSNIEVTLKLSPKK